MRPLLLLVLLLALAACTGDTAGAPNPAATPQAGAVQGSGSNTGGGPCVDSVVIQGGRMNPPELVVKAPCAVLFTNRDDAVVQIQGQDTTPFTLGEMGKDQSWAHTYKDPGRFEYFNTKDPSMRGAVVVR